MKKIAILASDNMMPSATQQRADMLELTEQMGKLVPAFAARNMELELLPWRGSAQKASKYDAVLPLFAWDYFEGNEAEFMSEMAALSRQSLLLNPYEILAWNANKTYLDGLKTLGAPVIETLTLAQVTQEGVRAALQHFGTDSLVIKPQIGGGAWRQVLWHAREAFPDQSTLPPDAIQSIYGGREVAHTPSRADQQTAQDILACLDFTPLYARIDLLRGRDGQLKLIELEMLEPYLYLAFADGEGGENAGAQKLAAALVKRLT